jgi:hypothetical protein
MSKKATLSEYEVDVITRHCTSLLEAAQSGRWTANQAVLLQDTESNRRQLEYWMHVQSALRWTIEQAKQRQRKSENA